MGFSVRFKKPNVDLFTPMSCHPQPRQKKEQYIAYSQTVDVPFRQPSQTDV